MYRVITRTLKESSPYFLVVFVIGLFCGLLLDNHPNKLLYQSPITGISSDQPESEP